MHALAKVRIRQAHHARLGVALHLLDSSFRRQAIVDRLFHAPHPALVMGKHAVGLEDVAVLAFHGNFAPRQHVVDRDPERAQRVGQPADFLLAVFVEEIGDDDARLVQHHVTEADAFRIAVAIDRHRSREIELQPWPGDLLQFAGGDHLGEHHRCRFERFELVFAIVALRLVLHDENAKASPGPQDRHAEEGMVDLFTGFRQVAEGRMCLGIRKIERLGRGRDRADQTLAHLQLGKVHRILVQTFGRIEIENAVRAENIGGAHFGDHVVRDLTNDPVQSLLRLERLRHQFAQPLEQDAGTRRKVSHRVFAPLPIGQRIVTLAFSGVGSRVSALRNQFLSRP